uniref:Mannosidase alpha class 2A member 2 n=1 Tax=Sphenodon punctatus TaxID=8508 RepID=A0A8D0GGK1_SPHPU
MKLKKQVTVCGAAIFCVAVFSLYLMLDRVQHDPAPAGGPRCCPHPGLSRLHIKDSVLELTANAEGQPVLLPFHTPNGSWVLPPESRPSFYSISPQDCQFALVPPTHQMLAVSGLLPFDNQDGGVWKQGFDIRYEPQEWDMETLQVFVVPHSHNDPGETPWGVGRTVLILGSAHCRLVGNGQLEMVTGGWVMPDEANSHYFAMIDQLIEGHQWLEKNIGATPRSGWAVDPFGHSSTMPYLLRRSNLTSMLIQRVHYSIKKHFAATQNLEFMWRQSWDPDSSTEIFCHMMPFYSYDVPHTCGPDPKVCCQFDFKRLPGGRINCPWKVPPRAITEANVAERAQLLLDQYRKKSKLYRSKVLLVPLGDDFRYDKPQEWDAQFLNYQRLFDFLNAHPGLHVQAQFGTLSDYFDAVYKRTGIVPGMRPPGFPVLSGDFFAYADREDHYWTGYYTSRPFYKSMSRVLEHVAGAEPHGWGWVLGGQGNHLLGLGLDTWGKGLTGGRGPELAVPPMGRVKPALVLWGAEPPPCPVPCRFVVVFNPLEQERLSVLSLLVNTPRVRVLNEEGQPLAMQLSAQWNSATDMVPDVYQVSVMARLPALGLSILQLCKSFDSHTTLKSSERLYLHGRDLPVRKHETFPVRIIPGAAEDFCLQNQHMQACFSGPSGLLKSVHRSGDEQEQTLSSQFLVYGTRSSKDKSGAYLFLPDGEAKPYAPKEPPVVRVTEGPFFSEVACYYQHVQQTVRLYNVPGVDGLSLDVSYLVDIRDHVNKELALRLSTDIESEDTFFTDLNGFQIQPRRYLKKLPLQANFYPMPAMAYIQDKQSRLTLHSAQALGVSSLHSGQLEVILDRRLMQDDNRGLGQGLKDNKQTCSHFRLLLEHRTSANKVRNPPAARQRLVYSAGSPLLLLSFASVPSPQDDSLPSAEMALILHRKGFDCGLEAKNLGFNCTTSQGKLVLGSLFQGLELASMQPASLTLMYPLGTTSPNSTAIHLEPMEIATFRLRFG